MNDIYIDDNGLEIDRNQIISKKFAQWRRNRKPTSAALLEKRIDAFFEFCSQYGIVPDIEKLALCLGVHRVSIYRWRHGQGCDSAWQEIIERALQQIAAETVTAGDDGRLSPVRSIWREKNALGYRDNVSLEQLAISDGAQESYTLPSALLEKYTNSDPEAVTDQIAGRKKVYMPLNLPELEHSEDDESLTELERMYGKIPPI